MCPQFERMKAIFGEKANVTPSATLELGVPSGASDGGDSDSSETLAARYDDEWGDNDELTYVPSALSPFLPLKRQTPQREHGESTASKAKRKEPPSKKKKAANLLKSSKHQKLDESSSKKAGPRICEEILMR
ncbi:hypothetical protein PC129_g24210 [Phytophthora cactorum]|uniref:Uncharacterized protein n=1 Tax=Phytophthora cactorum TaxID=29920 RepID=A0A8T1GZD3_9STRA|nr:hypothetical protein PC129_g24210 [Phytophthora cactorum]